MSDHGELREAALGYARRGWSVIPMHSPTAEGCSCHRPGCPAAGKHPRMPWEAAIREAAAEETVASWWERWPDANIGVVTGTVSGVVVLDVDPRNGGDDTLEALEERWGPLPPTLVDRTGGGGWHHWFAATDGVIASRDIGPGLDLKGEASVVVAPPSRHASGHHYRWLADPDTVEPAPPPPWLAAWPGGAPADAQSHPDGATVNRTLQEQEAFAETWARVGITLLPGDQYYLCPFHEEHHPSLHIDREGCRWYCFGCHLGGGIAALLDLLGEEHPARERQRRRGRVGSRLPITLSGNRTVEVVGESHHQEALLEISGGSRHYGGVELEAVAELVPDRDNPYDRNAVEVRIEGFPVGYLSREDAAELHPLVDESIALHGMATCPALIRGGWDRGRDEVGLFGVRLRLPAVD